MTDADLENLKKHCGVLFDTGEFDFIKEKLTAEEFWKLSLFVSYIYEAAKKEDEK